MRPIVVDRRVPSWRDVPSAWRDLLGVVAAMVVSWLVIEHTETCARFFDWVVENPNYGIDSAILDFILASVGIAVRRNDEARRGVVRPQLAEQHAQTLAYHDPLTGLQNRRVLNQRLDSLATSTPAGQAVGLLILDLDHFKAVNDVHEHLVGDRLLRLVAKRLSEDLLESQAIYRLGSNEFAVVCDMSKDDHDRPQRLARRIVQALAEPFRDEGFVLHIGASVGIAMFPSDAGDREMLLRRADIALYHAKQEGRGHYRSFEAAMVAEIRRLAQIESELRAGRRQKNLG